MTGRVRAGTVAVFALLCTVAFDACSDAGKSPVSPASPVDAVARFGKTKSTTTVSVTAADPAFGDQGELNETVTISGSGFKSGAQAAWVLNGAVDPTITVSSTQFVNSTTLVAVISIAPTSPLDFRDILVTNSDRTQGIGAAVFEVTQAHIVDGTSAARAVNDQGEATGSLANGGPFYYDIATGLLQAITSSTSGTGYDISPTGNAIAGNDGTGPVLFTRAGPIGTAWSATALPIDPSATGGSANAMVADPATGQVTLIGGTEYFPQSGGCAVSTPVVWSWQAATGTWQRTELPKNGNCRADIWPRGLSANGTAIGRVGGVAAVWTPDGSGAYTLTLLDGSYAYGINGDGTMVVGARNVTRSKLAAAYWLLSPSGWGHETDFPGGCSQARDAANSSGRVTLDCGYPAFMDAPYTTPINMGGVGRGGAFISGISPSGTYMVGNGTTSGNVQVGLYWQP